MGSKIQKCSWTTTTNNMSAVTTTCGERFDVNIISTCLGMKPNYCPLCGKKIEYRIFREEQKINKITVK